MLKLNATSREKFKRMGIAVGALVGLVMLIMFGLWASDKGTDRVPRTERITEVGTFVAQGSRIDPAEVWITQSEHELKALRTENTQQAKALEQLRQDLDRLRTGLQEEQTRREMKPRADQGGSSPSSTLPRLLPSVSEPSSNDALPLPRQLPAPNDIVQNAGRQVGSELQQARSQGKVIEPGILSLSLPLPAESKVAPSKKDQRWLDNWLPAGSFIGVTLLSGANAPTGGQAQSNPIPVLLQLDDDGNLPNGFSSKVRDCRITTAAYGDLPSERAYLRTEKMTCINHAGEILETSLKGYLSGEDGMAGMRGPVVEKRGQLIALSLLSGTLGGIGSGLSQGLTNLATTTSGNVLSVNPTDAMEYGAWSGVGKAMERMADWYLKRADELYPVIEIHAGRFGHIVLTDGLQLDVNLWRQQGDSHEQ